MTRARQPDHYSFQINGLALVKEGGNYKKCRTPEEAWELVRKIADLAQECFVVASLNTRNNVIDVHLITVGILDSALVHPREIFRPAITDNAAAICLMHNHPSGDPSPSVHDMKITRQLIEAGRILDIQVVDHVIIGNSKHETCRDFFSMREEGVCDFSV